MEGYQYQLRQTTHTPTEPETPPVRRIQRTPTRSSPFKRLLNNPSRSSPRAQPQHYAIDTPPGRDPNDLVSWMDELRSRAQNSLNESKTRDIEFQHEIEILQRQHQRLFTPRTEEFEKLARLLKAQQVEQNKKGRNSRGNLDDSIQSPNKRRRVREVSLLFIAINFSLLMVS